MPNSDDLTFTVPRFLSFIDLAYLFEAAKVADAHFESKLQAIDSIEKRNAVGNINATRQSLLRAVFISSYAILEQNLDELANMERAKNNISIAPNDLRHRGVARSLAYANKVLGKTINKSAPPWSNILQLQEVRNHLVHYGPEFASTKEHSARYSRFKKIDLISLRPAICFTIDQLENIFGVYTDCVEDYGK